MKDYYPLMTDLMICFKLETGICDILLFSVTVIGSIFCTAYLCRQNTKSFQRNSRKRDFFFLFLPVLQFLHPFSTSSVVHWVYFQGFWTNAITKSFVCHVVNLNH